jgi:hypothetical protein
VRRRGGPIGLERRQRGGAAPRLGSRVVAPALELGVTQTQPHRAELRRTGRDGPQTAGQLRRAAQLDVDERARVLPAPVAVERPDTVVAAARGVEQQVGVIRSAQSADDLSRSRRTPGRLVRLAQVRGDGRRQARESLQFGQARSGTCPRPGPGAESGRNRSRNQRGSRQPFPAGATVFGHGTRAQRVVHVNRERRAT